MMKTRLQELRKAAGFRSARAFAIAHGLNPGTYTNYEQGVTGLSLEKAWEFADIFDCSLDDLAGRKRPPKEYADPQQAQLNAMYERLEEAGKSAAVGSVRGILDQQVREKTGGDSLPVDNKRTA